MAKSEETVTVPTSTPTNPVSRSWSVRIDIEDASTKRGLKKATDVKASGTVEEMTMWFAKEIAKLDTNKSNSILRVTMNADLPIGVEVGLGL